MELLQDESDAVVARAASVIAAITDHCASSKVRLQSGAVSLENSCCNILFNPVQDAFIQGRAIELLLPRVFDEREMMSKTAMEALTHIISFNKEGKMVMLEGLLSIFDSGNLLALEMIETLVGSLEASDDDELVDLLQPRVEAVMQMLADKKIHSSDLITMALLCISTVCERVPSVRKRALKSDGVHILLDFINVESLEVKDAAVNAVWQLTNSDHHKGKLHAALSSVPMPVLDRLQCSIEEIIRVADELEADDNDHDRRLSIGDPGPSSSQYLAAGEANAIAYDVEYDSEARKLLDMIIKIKRSSLMGERFSAETPNGNPCLLM